MRCPMEGECFAKEVHHGLYSVTYGCNCLKSTNFGGKPCPFQKPKRDYTNGKWYPHRFYETEDGDYDAE